MNRFLGFVNIFSTSLKKLAGSENDSVVAICTANTQTETAEVYGLHGVVSRPAKGAKGIRVKIGSLNFVLGVYVYGIEPPTNPGETKIYSTDEAGVEKASVLLDKDGNMIVNEGANHATQYEALLTAFNQLKADFDGFINNKFNLHTHAGVTTGGGSTGVTPLVGTSSTADMTPAKAEEVRIP